MILIIISGERGIINVRLMVFKRDEIRKNQFYFYLNLFDEELSFRQQSFDFAEER